MGEVHPRGVVGQNWGQEQTYSKTSGDLSPIRRKGVTSEMSSTIFLQECGDSSLTF